MDKLGVLEERWRKEGRNSLADAAVQAGESIRKNEAEREAAGDSGADNVPTPLVIRTGKANVTLPERWVIAKENMSDEGDFSGELLDRVTGYRARFMINYNFGFLGIRPEEVDWQTVVYFERSPEGWFDRQWFVFATEEKQSVVAVHGIYACKFTVDQLPGAGHVPALEALKSIKVEAGDAWKVVRGKGLMDFELKQK